MITLTANVDPGSEPGPIPLFALFMAFFWLYNIIDAGRKAALYNHALAGGDQIDLPSDFVMPKFHDSIGAGLILIIGGVALLSYTKFGVPMDWFEEWWPVAPIGLGVYLFIKAMMERSAQTSE